MARKLTQKIFQRLRGLDVALRRLRQPLLEEKLGTRVIVRPAVRQRFRVRQEALPVVLLQPGQRGIVKRVATQTRRIVGNLLEGLSGLVKMPGLGIAREPPEER